MGALAWPLLGMLAGALLALQAPVNLRLAQGLGMPLAAAAVSFAMGALFLTVATFGLARVQELAIDWRGPALWTFLVGGLCGGVYVTISILLAPRVGAAALMAFLVSGQLIAGLLIDRAGLLGLVVREITLGRLAGALLLLVGALLIRFT